MVDHQTLHHLTFPCVNTLISQSVVSNPQQIMFDTGASPSSTQSSTFVFSCVSDPDLKHQGFQSFPNLISAAEF